MIDERLAKQYTNWILGDISRVLNERKCSVADLSLSPSALTALIKMGLDGTLSSTAAKTVFEQMLLTGKAPEEVAHQLGLIQVSDVDELSVMVAQVLEEHAGPATDYIGGKTNALGYLVGKCMQKSGGKGNPQVFSQLLIDALQGK